MIDPNIPPADRPTHLIAMTHSPLYGFMIENGYRLYYAKIEEFYKYKLEWGKRVESDAVCQANESLTIHVAEYCFYMKHDITTLEVSVRAEKHDQWWNLSCYSIMEKYFRRDIKMIEEKLIKIFNAL